MSLPDLKIYKAPMDIGQLASKMVERWCLFAKEKLVTTNSY